VSLAVEFLAVWSERNWDSYLKLLCDVQFPLCGLYWLKAQDLFSELDTVILAVVQMCHQYNCTHTWTHSDVCTLKCTHTHMHTKSIQLYCSQTVWIPTLPCQLSLSLPVGFVYIHPSICLGMPSACVSISWDVFEHSFFC
jgi:hypothetical protein